MGFLDDLADKKAKEIINISAENLVKFEILVTLQIGSAYFYHILFGFLDGVLDVEVGLGISNGVTNTNGSTWREYQEYTHQF